MPFADKACVPTAEEVLIRFEEIFILSHAFRMVALVAVPVVAEAYFAAVLADEAEVPLPLGLLLGLRLAHRRRLAASNPSPAPATTGLDGRLPALPLPHRLQTADGPGSETAGVR